MFPLALDRKPAAVPLGPTAAIIVLERAARWSLAARRVFPEARLLELRSLEDVAPTLKTLPDSVLLLEVLPKRAPQVISLMVRLQAESPRVMAIACVTTASPEWELLLREAGFALVVRSPRRLERLRSWLLRHLQRAPQSKLTLRDRIWRQLPWSEAAATASPDAWL